MQYAFRLETLRSFATAHGAKTMRFGNPLSALTVVRKSLVTAMFIFIVLAVALELSHLRSIGPRFARMAKMGQAERLHEACPDSSIDA